MPRVSVVIPAHNAMNYLPETVECVLAQTLTDFELLIVNDGSSDTIVEWAAQMTDPRVKLISQEKQGAPIARNTGISQAQGDYIALLDADDLWHPTKLEKQVRYLDEHPEVGLVYVWTALIDGQGRPTGVVWTSHVEGYVWEHFVVTDGMLGNGSVAMIRRCCFEVVGLFDPTLEGYQDKDLCLRIAAKYPFGVVKEVLNFYRKHASSMTSVNKQATILKAFRKVTEKAFESAPFELLYLRNRCYGRMSLFQSWLSLEHGNCEEAFRFRQQALLHYPRLRYTKDFIFLSLAIALTRYFGLQGYEIVDSFNGALRSLRHFVSGIKPYQNLPS
jgi:glycosyltransferase involved in cell wall biosynthesis